MPFWRLRSGPSRSILWPQRVADLVADGVAHDGAQHDDDDDAGQADAALGGQHAAEDGGGLAGEHEAEHHGVLGEDEQADQRVGLPPVQREQRLEQPADHGAPSVRRRRRAERRARHTAIVS